MSKPRASLASVKITPPRPHPTEDLASPPAAVPETAPPPTVAASTTSPVEAGKGTTVHLTKAAAKELKKLAADRETTVHALMIEGVNLVFQKYDLPQIAEAGARPKPTNK